MRNDLSKGFPEFKGAKAQRRRWERAQKVCAKPLADRVSLSNRLFVISGVTNQVSFLCHLSTKHDASKFVSTWPYVFRCLHMRDNLPIASRRWTQMNADGGLIRVHPRFVSCPPKKNPGKFLAGYLGNNFPISSSCRIAKSGRRLGFANPKRAWAGMLFGHGSLVPPSGVKVCSPAFRRCETA